MNHDYSFAESEEDYDIEVETWDIEEEKLSFYEQLYWAWISDHPNMM